MKETYLNYEHKKIAEWLKKIRFRKKIVGGVCEQDVWTKIEELNKMYEKALVAERARYDTLLAKQRKSTSIKPGTPKPEQIRRSVNNG